MTTFRYGPAGYWTQAGRTTANVVVSAVTLGRKLLLEGRRSRTHWRNWTRGEQCDIDDGVAPTNEQEIVDRILSEPKLRCVGSGHSFNSAVRGESLLSLDRYTGVIEDFDHSPHVAAEKGVTYVRVRAGTRIRDLNRALHKRGLAIAALPSHDAQSVAGILSTDVHGTGRDIGFVSASVVGLRIIDGLGQSHDVWSGDPHFRAAIGGIGAVGVITEASVRCVPAFHIRQKSQVISVDQARAEWQRLLAAHDHMSFYVFPFASSLQLHTWDRTDKPTTTGARLREFLAISWAALGAAWLGDAFAASGKLPRLATWAANRGVHSNLVMDSAAGFNRSIYHLHQELEFAVAVDQTWTVIDELTKIYESLYSTHRMPYTLLETRFTPPNGTTSLISPGAGDRGHVWVTLVCNQSAGFAEYFAAVEDYLLSIDARPHLGKWCERYTHTDMVRLHGDAFREFQTLIAAYDPEGRFRNDFTNRIFGPENRSETVDDTVTI